MSLRRSPRFKATTSGPEPKAESSETTRTRTHKHKLKPKSSVTRPKKPPNDAPAPKQDCSMPVSKGADKANESTTDAGTGDIVEKAREGGNGVDPLGDFDERLKSDEYHTFNCLRNDSILGDKGSDIQTWYNLDGSINFFCQGRFKCNPWDSLSDSAKEKFALWAPNARRLFETTEGHVSQYFFCSWIWRVLDEHIFTRQKHELIEWTSPFYKMQNDMREYLLDISQDMPTSRCDTIWHHWKWATPALLRAAMDKSGQKFPHQRITKECVLAILERELGSYVSEDLSKMDGSSLARVGECVARADAFFSVTMSHLRHSFSHPETKESHGFPFHRDLGMKEIITQQGLDMTEGCRVELVVAPMLICTAPLGLGYHRSDNSFCWEPMAVLFDLSDELWEKGECEESEEGRKEGDEEERNNTSKGKARAE